MTQTVKEASIEPVKDYFQSLQEQICATLEALEIDEKFSVENISTPGGGLSKPRVLSDGEHIEKAAVMFTHSIGDSLPPAATERNPKLAGKPFQAAAISLIVHPKNPFVPMTHMNLRFFIVFAEEPSWHFGGGYDLTPYYPYEQDIVHWHSTASQAAGKYYRRFKDQCDDYFYLPHRGEARGVGGLFFDDWAEEGFKKAYDLTRRIGDSFLNAYQPIFEKRKNETYTEKQKDFQLYRRGRYAEFNLAVDRGTKYGLQSGRRIESVLASLPPLAKWSYNYPIEPDSDESKLTDYYLMRKDWI